MATIVLSAAGMALGGSASAARSSASPRRSSAAPPAPWSGRAIDERLLGARQRPGRDRARRPLPPDRRLGGQRRRPRPRRRRASAARSSGRPGSRRSSTTRRRQGRAPARGHDATATPSRLALALCEGVITGVGRIWADGQRDRPRRPSTLSVYRGSEDQLPDPRMEAVEGAGRVPAYRGIAYVVIEDLDLGRFGNRVPQLSFEVFRPAARRATARRPRTSRGSLRGVALIPGTGEYALATDAGLPRAGLRRGTVPANVNTAQGRAGPPRLARRPRRPQLPQPRLGLAGGLLVRRRTSAPASARVRPKVEQADAGRLACPGRSRASAAREAAARPARPTAGRSTAARPPTRSVVQAIQRDPGAGQGRDCSTPSSSWTSSTGNGAARPLRRGRGQPALPWRGRITLSVAPGRPGSPGRHRRGRGRGRGLLRRLPARPTSRSQGDGVAYSGPDEWSFRRMILHYAHLCAAAGGVDAFCIGTEMRGPDHDPRRRPASRPSAALRHLAARGQGDPAGRQDHLRRRLVASSRATSPPGTADDAPLPPRPALGRPGDRHDRRRQLPAALGLARRRRPPRRPLGRHPRARLPRGQRRGRRALRLVLPLRRGARGPGPHADHRRRRASPGSGGARTSAAGGRAPPPRPRGRRPRQPCPTAWVPRSKPFWFTEIGCAAIDKGTNEPNKFLDPKSSESVAAALLERLPRRPDPGAVLPRHPPPLGRRRPTTPSRRSTAGR